MLYCTFTINVHSKDDLADKVCDELDEALPSLTALNELVAQLVEPFVTRKKISLTIVSDDGVSFEKLEVPLGND